ncbi:UNVERIFIED_CONTAM: hypothetical protein GTU68_025879 [Idotea baltica]|nr:hypothetical protein [Idotea baltica]
MRTVLLGAPGSGKGTQGVVLSKKYNIPQVSTGDLLRAAVAAGSELGKKAKSAMNAGALVSDDIVIGLIRERISQSDATEGYILDGFPRNIPQAEALDSMLEELNQPLQSVVLLDVPFEELMQRLTGRRTCKDCGAIYNRADDNEETIGNRLTVYQDQTSPLINYYQQQQKLHTLAGTGDVDDITRSVDAIFDTI